MQYMTDTVFQYKINEVLNYATVVGFANKDDKRKHIKIPRKIGEYPVFEVGEFAFHKNVYIELVTLPGDTSMIGKNAFGFCPNLKAVYIYPASKKFHTIIFDPFAFADCKKLQTITGEDWLGYCCADYAFQHCEQLKRIQGQLYWTAAGSFLDCINLTDITFADGIKWTDTTFRGCHKLKTVSVLGGIDNSVSEFCIRWLKNLCIKCPKDSTLVDWAYDGVNIQII